ncbi:MAG: Poly(Hydroxyalcanoate) granule associated protein (Phasin) [Thermocaproicibacter melissae]|jgi:polyhydroxyalkanoate synthesis regulator phasin|uniref:phasin family protein n=1 Tax=Thermocaproicibacter melissae TaxID=2966552 RepID=UPI0024B0647C|nr:phasin family protein [Thermocaproicibacter melissae]WBY64286.1 phasin family protein [Thermocaproicibacter melissae]
MMSEELKKIFLAGLGAVAITAEKSKQIVDELVKKGELTLEQGKQLNEELKHDACDKIKKHVTVNVTHEWDGAGISEAISKMTSEELANLKADIARREKALQEPEVESDGED